MDPPYDYGRTILKNGCRATRARARRRRARCGSGMGRGRDKKKGGSGLPFTHYVRRGAARDPKPFRIATDSSISNRCSPARNRRPSLPFSLSSSRLHAARLPATPRSCKAPPYIICRRREVAGTPFSSSLLGPPHALLSPFPNRQQFNER